MSAPLLHDFIGLSFWYLRIKYESEIKHLVDATQYTP